MSAVVILNCFQIKILYHPAGYCQCATAFAGVDDESKVVVIMIYETGLEKHIKSGFDGRFT